MKAKFQLTGIDALSGKPLIPAVDLDEFYTAIDHEHSFGAIDKSEKKAIARALELQRDPQRGLRAKLDPLNLGDAGWGLVYPQGTDPLVLEALEPLVQRRNGLKIEVPTKFFNDAHGFRKSKKEKSGNVDPQFLPYYMLLVGPPGAPGGLTFRFQHNLSDVRPVGRAAFSQPQGYAAYASKVIEYEKGLAAARKPRLELYSTCTDEATKVCDQYLAENLVSYLKKYQIAHSARRGADATRAALVGQLKSDAAVLFTASHGLSYPYLPGNPPALDAQQRIMGALLTADWDGKEGPVAGTAYLAGEHLDASFDLRGLIVFSFACYSAGAPQNERFAEYYKRQPLQTAPADFVTRLPQKMLELGALAFIGHVEKSWGYSFVAPDIGADTATYEDLLALLLDGRPVGLAFEETMTRRYLDKNGELTEEMNLFEQFDQGHQVDRDDVVKCWTDRQDARAYILLGDPFVKVKI
jgi:hypothetical protein